MNNTIQFNDLDSLSSLEHYRELLKTMDVNLSKSRQKDENNQPFFNADETNQKKENFNSGHNITLDAEADTTM